AAGNSGSPGSDNTKRPSVSRYCGGLTRTTVARTVSLRPSARCRTNVSACPTACCKAASRSVAGRATPETSATLESGENSVAGSHRAQGKDHIPCEQHGCYDCHETPYT